MAYAPIVLPSQTPAVVEGLIRGAVEPYLSDVNAMLRLPQADTPAHVGCNLAIAQVLLAVVSGVSAVLYSTKGGTRKVFQAFLNDFYPWHSEPKRVNLVTGEEAARILYEDFRNPLTHSTGTPVFDVPGEARRQFIPTKPRVRLDRVAFHTHPDQGLPEERLLELESEPARPAWLPVTLAGDSAMRVLTVESLYWGIRRSIQVLCSDDSRMAVAVEFFRHS